MTDNTNPSNNSLLITGAFATFMGLFIILVSVDIIHTDLESIHAPRWMLSLAGMLTAFVSVFLWVGFGIGEREFSGFNSFLFFTVSGEWNDLMGRIMFGGGGILAAILTGYYAFTGARKIISAPPDDNDPQ